MPRYYFHCRVGDLLAEDREGSVLRDIEAARHDATTIMGELARDELSDEGIPAAVVIEVADHHKWPLFTLQLLPGGQYDG